MNFGLRDSHEDQQAARLNGAGRSCGNQRFGYGQDNDLIDGWGAADRLPGSYSGAPETYAYVNGEEHHLHFHWLEEDTQFLVAPHVTNCALFVWKGEVESGDRY